GNAPQERNLVGCPERQWTKQCCLDHAENGGACTDRERQCRDHRRGERRLLAKRSEREADVVGEKIHGTGGWGASLSGDNVEGRERAGRPALQSIADPCCPPRTASAGESASHACRQALVHECFQIDSAINYGVT